jgi:NADPH-dependent 7-cyano-7-deazaguanine reductase QueF
MKSKCQFKLHTQRNEKRCRHTVEKHILLLPRCCPVTQNPQPGSRLVIKYKPLTMILEVQSLYDYIQSYVGGRGDVRSMEGMIQNITQDCANAVLTYVKTKALLLLEPEQKMKLKCEAWPKT